MYALRAAICFYGQHYSAFVLTPDAGGWLLCDDAHVALVGAWPDVVRKCAAGRIQPSVLFYSSA